MKKLILYKNAMVEVHDGNEIYLSAIPWKVYFEYLFKKCLGIFDKDIKIFFVPPWKVSIVE